MTEEAYPCDPNPIPALNAILMQMALRIQFGLFAIRAIVANGA